MSTEVEQNKDNDRVEKRTTTNDYPFHKTWTSMGGIRVEYGDQKGKEFFKITMPDGSFTEMYPDGKKISFTVGDNKNYNKSGVTFSVDENNDIHIHGHNNIKIGGGAHIEVVGNAGIAVGGDIALVGIGNLNFDVENCYMGVRGNFGMRVEGNAKWKIDGTVEFISDKTAKFSHGDTRTDISPYHKIDTPTHEITHNIIHGGHMNSVGIHKDAKGYHT